VFKAAVSTGDHTASNGLKNCARIFVGKDLEEIDPNDVSLKKLWKATKIFGRDSQYIE
jgi:hypothetical protein